METAVSDVIESSVQEATRAWQNYEPVSDELDASNGIIYQMFASRRFDECLSLIEQQLAATFNLSFYPLLIKGLVFRCQGKLNESLQTFQKLARLDPTRVSVLKQLALALSFSKKHEKAIELLKKTLQYAGKDEEVYASLGLAHSLCGDYDTASKFYRSALECGKSPLTYLRFGKLLQKIGSRDLALGLYLEGIDANPDNGELLTALGELQMLQGRYTQGAIAFCRVLDRQPVDYTARFGIGAALLHRGQFDEALTQFRVCAVLQPNSPDLWNNISVAFACVNKHIVAAVSLKHALYFAPISFEILYNLGLIYLSLKQDASAFLFLEAAARRSAGNACVFGWLGVALARLNDFEMAEVSFQRALQAGKGALPWPKLRLNYALILLNLGKKEESLEHYYLYKAHIQKSGQSVDVSLTSVFET